MILMDFMIKKNNFIINFVLFFLIIFIYFFSRFQNITSIPVFGDEAIYIRWAQIIQSEENLRFIPQTDGKQPLFMWINAITLKIIKDPLVSGRIISIFSGFGIAIFLFFVTSIILNYEIKELNPIKFIKLSICKYFYPSLLTILIYCFLPYSFFFDRLALADNILSFFGIFSLFLILLLSKYPRLDISFILGLILGLSWLTKSPAIYFIILSFFTFLLLNIKKIFYSVYPLISIFIAFIIYNILRLGPQFHMISLRNKDYIWTLSEILKHPLDPLKPHLIDTFNIYSKYISFPLLFFSLIGFLLFFLNKKNKYLILNTKYLILLLWWILPLFANCAFAKVFTARYILFTLPSQIVLISIFLSKILILFKFLYLKIFFFIFLFIFNILFIYKISTNPFNQKLPSSEQGYLSDWTSGWGIKNISEYLKQKSLSANVIVGTEGYFGTLPDGLQIYTNKVKQLTVIGIGLGFTKIPQNLVNAKNYGDDVYLIINKSRLNLSSIEQDKLRLVKSYPKPDSDYLLLYQLK